MSDIRLFLSTVEFDPISIAIRLHTNCAWSHTGFIRLSDRYTFSAMADGGVRWRSPDPHAKILVLSAIGQDAALSKALTMEGEGYDFLNILGIAFHKNWETPGRLICDKLVFWAFQEISAPLLMHKFIPIEHLTPRDVLLSPYVMEDTENEHFAV